MSVSITGRKLLFHLPWLDWSGTEHIKMHSVEKHYQIFEKGLEHMISCGSWLYDWMPVANMFHFSLFNDGINKGILFVLY